MRQGPCGVFKPGARNPCKSVRDSWSMIWTKLAHLGNEYKWDQPIQRCQPDRRSRWHCVVWQVHSEPGKRKPTGSSTVTPPLSSAPQQASQSWSKRLPSGSLTPAYCSHRQACLLACAPVQAGTSLHFEERSSLQVRWLDEDGNCGGDDCQWVPAWCAGRPHRLEARACTCWWATEQITMKILWFQIQCEPVHLKLAI